MFAFNLIRCARLKSTYDCSYNVNERAKVKLILSIFNKSGACIICKTNKYVFIKNVYIQTFVLETDQNRKKLYNFLIYNVIVA